MQTHRKPPARIAIMLFSAVALAFLLVAVFEAGDNPSRAAPGGGQGQIGGAQYQPYQQALRRIVRDLGSGNITVAEAEARFINVYNSWLSAIALRLDQAAQNDILFESVLKEYVDWKASVDSLLDNPGAYLLSIDASIVIIEDTFAFAWLHAVEESDARCVRIRDWRSYRRLFELFSLLRQDTVREEYVDANVTEMENRLLVADPCLRVVIRFVDVNEPLEACVWSPVRVRAGFLWRDGVVTIPQDPVRVSVAATDADVRDPSAGLTGPHGDFNTEVRPQPVESIELGVNARFEQPGLSITSGDRLYPITVTDAGGCGASPTATITPATNTPTATSSPDPTPTHTHTPTPTPVTATPTATPTAECLTTGGMGSYLIPAAPIGSVFFSNTVTVEYAGGQVFLARDCDLSGTIVTDDIVVISTSLGELRWDFSGGCGLIIEQPPFDITHLFQMGANSVSIQAIEGCGGGSFYPVHYIVVRP